MAIVFVMKYVIENMLALRKAKVVQETSDVLFSAKVKAISSLRFFACLVSGSFQ